MRLKTLVIVIGVLAAASVAVYFTRQPAAPVTTDARVGQPLVEPKLIESAAKLRLSDQGKTVTLARQADGTWRVSSYYDTPADFTKLSGFVGSLTEAKIQELVTTSPSRIARLEFKDTKIELLDAADKVTWSVLLGKNRELGGGRYVRFGEEPKAFVTNLNAFLDAEAKSWASAELLNVKPEDVAKVEIPFAEGGPITVSRAKKDDPWTADKTPANQKVKADKIASLLTSVGNVRFSETSAPDDAVVGVAKANQRTFKLTTFDNKTYTIALGRKPEEKKPKPAATTPPTPATPPVAPAVPVDPSKPAEPEFETIPAGPVYAFITDADAAAPINALMQKRAFQVYEYSFTSLPQKAEELFEPAPAATPAPTPAPAPVEPKKSEEKK